MKKEEKVENREEVMKFLKEEITETIDLIRPLVEQEAEIVSKADGDWGYELLQERIEDLKTGSEVMGELLDKIYNLSKGFDKYCAWSEDVAFADNMKKTIMEFTTRRTASVDRYKFLQQTAMKSKQEEKGN